MKYKWRSEVESSIFIYDNEMAQFDIVSAKRYLKHKVYHSGKEYFFSSMTTFGREVSFFIISQKRFKMAKQNPIVKTLRLIRVYSIIN